MKKAILIFLGCLAVCAAPFIVRKITRGDTGLGSIEYSQGASAGYKARK